MSVKYGYIFKKSKIKLTSLNIAFNIGAVYEEPGLKGVSHLMEHLIAKTINKYTDRFTNDCIEFNAYTSMSHVVVYFNGLEKKLTPEFKQELVHCILNNFNEITEEEFNNEKQVVLQELYDSFEDPGHGHFLNLLYNTFGVSTPIGIPEDVANFSFDAAKALAQELFTKPARIVEVAAKPTNFDVEYSTKISSANIPKYKPNDKIICPVAVGEKINAFAVSKRIVNKSEFPYLCIGLDMLCDGLKSPFHEEIRNKRGLSYFVSADCLPVLQKGIMSISACTTPDRKDELCQVIKDMSDNIKLYLTKERFKIVTNFIKTYQEVKQCLQYKNVDELLRQEELSMPKNIDKITFEKVVEVTEKYFGKNLVIITK